MPLVSSRSIRLVAALVVFLCASCGHTPNTRPDDGPRAEPAGAVAASGQEQPAGPLQVVGVAPPPEPWLSSSLSSPNQAFRCGAGGELFAVFNLGARQVPMAERLPMNLSLVIDRSGSMESENKLEYVKSAAEYLVRNMLPEDVLSLVIYDDQVQVLSAAAPVVQPDVVVQLIRALTPGSLTYIEGGLRQGAAEVEKQLSTERVNRVLLLSDGMANVGISDPRGLGQIARELASRGIATTAMGVGTEYSEETMMQLAEYGRGNYHFIGEPAQIPEIFRAELEELEAVVVQDSALALDVPEGLELQEVYGFTDLRGAHPRFELPLGDMFSGDDRRIVVRLRITDPSRESFRLGSRLDYRPAQAGAEALGEARALDFRCVDSEQALARAENATVREEVEYVLNAASVDLAMQHYNAGEVSIAKDELERRIEQVKPLAENSGNARLKEQLHALESARSDMDALQGQAVGSAAVQTFIKGRRAASKVELKKSKGAFKN